MTEIEAAAVRRQDSLRRAAPPVQHEINNAMMVLAANLDLLKRAVPEGASQRQLERAVQASLRLESTIRCFLDAARRPAEDAVVVSPAVALRQALPLLRVVLGARVSLDAAAPEAVPEVRMDRAAFDLGLLTLMQDMATVMPPGSRIALTLREDSTIVVSLPEIFLELAAEALAGAADRVVMEADAVVLGWAAP